MRRENGTFAPGNPGGPGRPRRAVEREYLVVLNEVVGLESWREICLKAAEDAKGGDAKAREWLSRHLLGEKSSLLDIAAAEACNLSVEEEIDRAGQTRCMLAMAAAFDTSESD